MAWKCNFAEIKGTNNIKFQPGIKIIKKLTWKLRIVNLTWKKQHLGKRQVNLANLIAKLIRKW